MQNIVLAHDDRTDAVRPCVSAVEDDHVGRVFLQVVDNELILNCIACKVKSLFVWAVKDGTTHFAHKLADDF